MQVYAYRVLLAIKENTGIEIPDDRLFRHIVPGIHPSLSKLLTYPPPLTLAQLFSWYETAIDKLERDDPFLLANTTPVTGVAPSAAEEQEHDLIVRENDNATCYRCGTMGHYAAFCDRKRVNSLRGKRKNKKRRTHCCTQVYKVSPSVCWGTEGLDSGLDSCTRRPGLVCSSFKNGNIPGLDVPSPSVMYELLSLMYSRLSISS
ncbi:unnamed protein product [Orchesella dallaii]|uniref:CCHC-type domain-containing protein n=1 Tax=Orchesella dallaii TaxID=48710 RepID=A0ABP1PZN6_9HEXA